MVKEIDFKKIREKKVVSKLNMLDELVKTKKVTL